MAQRQFRSDDTSQWVYKYGSGSAGDLSINTTQGYSAANAGCSGTSSSTSLSLDAASTFANGDLVLIHQTRGSGVTNPNWELNKISSGGGTTSLTLEFPLTRTYTDSGANQAQIIQLNQYKNITLGSSALVNGTNWDGNKGGIIAYMASQSITGSGSLNITQRGFAGGFGAVSGSPVSGYSGEGTGGVSQQSNTNNNNGNGGGPGYKNDSSLAGIGGGGGGNATTGGNGSGDGLGGTGGAVGGNSELTLCVFGGGGGGGRNDFVSAGAGGYGAGIIFLFSPTITLTGAQYLQGGQGEDRDEQADGGSGAGGSFLAKGVEVSLGSGIVANGASAVTGTAGAGSTGIVHVDYAKSVSVSSNPSASTRSDVSLFPGGGSFLALL